MTAPELWEHRIGLSQPFTVYEHVERGFALYVRWRAGGNWKKRALAKELARRNLPASIRDPKGQLLPKREREAIQQAAIDIATTLRTRMTGGLAGELAAQAKPVTIGQAKALVTDTEKGKYRQDTPHRRAVMRALDFAVSTWGSETPWNAITQTELTQLGVRKLRQLVQAGKDGYRAAEETVAYVLAVAQWLKDTKRIAVTAVMPSSTWKEELRTDYTREHGTDRPPEPDRPRYTLEEMRTLLRVAGQVDPRLDLLVSLGAELRLGQVRRAWRSAIALTPPSMFAAAIPPDERQYGSFTVPRVGKKRGTVVLLTRGQRAAVDAALHSETGYLRELEAAWRERGEDYRLFPAGQMPGNRPWLFRPQENGRPRSYQGPPVATATIARHQKAEPITGTAIRKWWLEAEELAKIAHVDGRGPYGIRRIAVDAAKEAGISREALQQHGGWADTQVPDTIYADQEAEYARREAARVRAKIRGETE